MKVLIILLYILILFPDINLVAQQWTENPQFITSDPDFYVAWRRGYFEGYTTAPSIPQGQPVQFKVSTKAAIQPNHQVTTVSSRMKIYRVNSTSMSGDILMTPTAITFNATFYPLHDKFNNQLFPEDSIYHYTNGIYPVEYKKGCDWANWAVAYTLQNTSNYPSGFYYAKLYLPGQEFNPERIGYIPFVIKPSSPASTSKMLCVIAWNTYQAYNYWGGGSLYWWTGDYDITSEGSSIETVSFRRPFVYHFFDCCPLSTQFGQLDQRERNFIAWVENNGYQMEYCVDSDISGGFSTSLYKAIIFPGHSEYWDPVQRSNIENDYKGEGGNFAFLAANNCYWLVDYKGSSSNPDSMYCYKPETPGKPDGDYLWRNQTEGPEGQFIGVQFYGVNNTNEPQIVENPTQWIFNGTGLSFHSQFGFGGANPIASGESDMKRSEYSPANTVLLARVLTGVVQHYPYYGDDLYADMTYYEDTETNSRVFAAGGFGWTDCLFGGDYNTVRTITRNILDHFSLKKYIGNIYTTLDNPLEWDSNIELDGNVNVLSGKYLKITSTTVSIDPNVVLYTDGTVEINGNVTFDGSGSFNINPSGRLLLKAGSTLTVNSYFVLENGTNQITFESGSRLIINDATIESGATLTVGSGGTLEVKPGATVLFGSGTSLVINGTLSANGSTGTITFDFVERNSNGIQVNSGGTANISYADILNATNGIYFN
jgi:hypothetical protein